MRKIITFRYNFFHQNSLNSLNLISKVIKATLQDISTKTGLSISTVSRILRGESKTSSENVALTIKTAQEINYPINSRILNGKYSYKNKLEVALVTSLYPNEFYSAFFHGFSSATLDTNINLSLHVFNPNANTLSELITNLSFNSTDAAILFIPTLQIDDYKTLLNECPPDFSLISVAPLFNPVLDTITFDSYRGGYIAGDHFFNKGYKRVGTITGPVNRNESLLRKNGFLDFLNQKAEMELVWQFEGDYTLESGKSAFKNYMELEEKPNAIFASNDYMCLGFIEEAHKAGLKIPNDIAIAGYDDLPICSYMYPSITSVHTDYEKLAKKAYSIINEKIETSSLNEGILSLVPVSLSERKST